LSRLKNSQAKATVIFDGDDTLWETQSLYEVAKEEFFREMAKLGFRPDKVRERFETIDHANVKKRGFSKSRFPRSMAETYRAFCVDNRVAIDNSIARRARYIGGKVFRASPRILDEVVDTLSELRARKIRLLLATKGERDVQERRVEQSGLRYLFDRVFIFGHKGREEFEHILLEEDIDASKGWSVGNSIKSDINPALTVGLNAIWIPQNTWAYEEERPIVSSRLYKVQSIRQITEIILGST